MISGIIVVVIYWLVWCLVVSVVLCSSRVYCVVKLSLVMVVMVWLMRMLEVYEFIIMMCGMLNIGRKDW